MKKYSRIFGYLGNYKSQIGLYFLFIILSVVFSIVSVGMLMPFLELIFNGNNGTMGNLAKNSNNPVIRYIRDLLLESINSNNNPVQGKLKTLGLICAIIIITILLKNLLFYLSPQLTLFLLIFIPIIGFIIGRVTRSLKKQSQEAAIKYGESVSVLDETLTGLRVIKAFNMEAMLKNRFFRINNELLRAKNKIGYRRDLASPLSEFLGVVVFSAILWYGGSGIIRGNIPLEGSAFIGYLALFYNIINPAKKLSTSFSHMQKGSAAIARIEEG